MTKRGRLEANLTFLRAEINKTPYGIEYDLYEQRMDRANDDKTKIRDLINGRYEDNFKRPGLGHSGNDDESQLLLKQAFETLQSKYDVLIELMVDIEDKVVNDLKKYDYEKDTHVMDIETETTS